MAQAILGVLIVVTCYSVHFAYKDDLISTDVVYYMRRYDTQDVFLASQCTLPSNGFSNCSLAVPYADAAEDCDTISCEIANSVWVASAICIGGTMHICAWVTYVWYTLLDEYGFSTKAYYIPITTEAIGFLLVLLSPFTRQYEAATTVHKVGLAMTVTSIISPLMIYSMYGNRQRNLRLAEVRAIVIVVAGVIFMLTSAVNLRHNAERFVMSFYAISNIVLIYFSY
jgi:hypothetical protein